MREKRNGYGEGKLAELAIKRERRDREGKTLEKEK